MDRYVQAAFSVGQIERELADPQSVFFIALTRRAPGGDVLVGYARLHAGPPPACVRGPAPLELARLYVDPEWHGRGVADALLHPVIEHARAQGAQTLWLGVWRNNHRARRFYEKRGFVRVGDHPFLFGQDMQRDEVYARPVSSDSAPNSSRSAG